MTLLYVALGGALGSVLRFWLGGAVGERAGAHFWGTLAVNVIGSFVIGICAATRPGDFTRHFVMIGILGGFTTFSSFSLQTLELFQRGSVGLALANVGLSIALCLLGVWLGNVTGRAAS
jgi:fluoride exporter